MSANGRIITIRAPQNNYNRNDSRYARMHSYSDHANMWKQLGSAIVGAEVGDRFRYLVAINTNSTMFVTRAAFNNNSSCMSSHVRIYSYSVNTYV